MENKTDNKVNGGRVAIIGAAITAIAGIITAIVTISGPLIDKKLAIQTTQTREAVLFVAANVSRTAMQLTDTPIPRVPKDAVEPTQADLPVAVIPTATLSGSSGGTLPQATEASPGKMLKVGESVTSNGIQVKLTQVEFPAANEVHLHFTVTNTTKKVIHLVLDHNRDVSLTDDLGTAFQWATAFTWDVSIYPGTSRNDEVKRRGDVSKANYFIVKLEIPGLLSGQWKN